MENTRKPRTDEELVEASEQVLQELQDLWSAEIVLMVADSSEANEVKKEMSHELEGVTDSVRDAIVEVVALHAGLLLEFLYGTDPEPDDIVAEDFFDEPTAWSEQRPRVDETMAAARRAGALQRRMKYSGWVQEDDWKAVESKELTLAIADVLREFVRLAPEARTSEELRSYLTEKEEALREFVRMVPEGRTSEELRDYLAAKKDRLDDEDAQGADAA